jgi:hypothetical protein
MTPVGADVAVQTLLGGFAVLVLLSTYPFVATAIAYRRRDNGLAYILLLMGISVWNAMLAAQLLSPRPLVKGFFLSLSVVGSLLAALGWFLFACTASSTPHVPRRRLLYGSAAALTGVDILLAMTAPAHSVYWVVPEPSTLTTGFAVITPKLGYWLHIQLLVVLLGGGTLLFAAAWERGNDVRFTRLYTIAGTATVAGVLWSAIAVPGGTSVAPLLAASLSAIGWFQARQVSWFVEREWSVWRTFSQD